MREFESSVGEILERLGIGVEPGCFGKETGEIRAGDLEKVVAELHGGFVNCYPGTPGVGCSKLAYFFSLKNPDYTTGRGQLTFKKALEALVGHFTGSCDGVTKRAVFITDSWDPVAFTQWRPTIENLNKRYRLEFYLVVNGREIKLQI